MGKSILEAALAFQIRAAKLPAPVTEHRFAPPRRWRFDACWPDHMLAVEVNGGSWVNGRHNRPEGQIADNNKLNAATELGWKVLRYTGQQVEDGSALDQIERMLKSAAE